MTKQETRFKDRWDTILLSAFDTVRKLVWNKPAALVLLTYNDTFDAVKTAEWAALEGKADV